MKYFLFVVWLGISLQTWGQSKNEVTQDFPMAAARTIEIQNRKNTVLEINTWEGATVRVSYTFDTSNTSVDGPADKLSSFGFETKQIGDKLILISNPVDPVRKFSQRTLKSRPMGQFIVIDGKAYYKNGEVTAAPGASSPEADEKNRGRIRVQVPAGKKISVINSGGDIDLLQPLDDIAVDINTGSFRAMEIKRLSLKSTFSNVELGEIGEASIDINGGQLSIQNVANLTINSRYTQPRIQTAGTVAMTSLADNYTFGQVTELTGSKTFGSCIVGFLKKKVEMDKGRGMSLQLKQISPAAELVRISTIDDSLELPVSSLRNYSIEVDAPGNSELWLTDEMRKNIVFSKTVSGAPQPVTWDEAGSVKFRCKVGDGSGKPTVFQLDCVKSTIRFF